MNRRLADAGVSFEERDLTAPEHSADLAYFQGLGYRSAPVTEFGELAVPGFMPSEIDRVIEAWRAAHPIGDEWQYGWNTGSEVDVIGDRAAADRWAAERGMTVGVGDWGSRFMRRLPGRSWESVA